MSQVFLQVVNMGISASWLILAVLLLRFVTGKGPKWIRVLLWGLVALRLLLPFSPESVLSLIPSSQTISPEIMLDPSPAIHSGLPYLNTVVNPVLAESFAPSPGASINPLQIWIPLFALLWIIGLAAMLLYALISYLRLSRSVRTGVLLRENIYQSEAISSPFVLGIIKPKIYLPFCLETQAIEAIIAHEAAHIHRWDHWWKPLGFVLLSLHWMNPLMWLSYLLLCRDIELACDEKVIKSLDTAQRADYSQALLSCSIRQRMISACPLAFGETGVKGRIRSVLSYKKPALWLVVLALVLCSVAGVCFLTDPISPPGYIKLVERNDAMNQFHYQLKPDPNLHGQLYAEQWVDGVCERTGPLPLSQFQEQLVLTVASTREEGTSLFFQGDGENFSYPTITFPDPQGHSLISWGTAFPELNESLPIAAGESHILMAMVFDEGAGIRVFDCETLKSEPERLEKNCWVLVRASFSSPQVSMGRQDVIDLSQKGEKLSWEDFSAYNYVETPSAFQERQYPIDEHFTLLVGGNAGKDRPNYILLRANDETEETLDLRQGNAAEFISQHENNVPVWPCTTQVQCSPVGLDPQQKAVGTIALELSTVQCDSLQDLEAYRKKMAPSLDFDRSYPDCPSLNEAFSRYDAEFFRENTLFLLYREEEKPSHRHALEYCRVSEGVLSIGLQVIAPDSGEERPEGWLLSLAIPRAQVMNVTAIDARVCATVYPDRGTANAKPTHHYVFEESEEILKPSLTLFDNGMYSFTFSAISSYLGMGNYEIEDGRLTLYADEKPVYYFDILGNDLSFDAKSSVKQTWYSGLYDGAIMKFRPISQEPPELAPLEEAISEAILNHYRETVPEGSFPTESHVLLANEIASGTPKIGASNHMEKATVYLLVLQLNFKLYPDRVEEVSGSYIPTALTFSLGEDGSYSLEEYWEPRDGSNYSSDILKKFPGTSAQDALNGQLYTEELTEQCWQKALAEQETREGIQ